MALRKRPLYGRAIREGYEVWAAVTPLEFEEVPAGSGADIKSCCGQASDCPTGETDQSCSTAQRPPQKQGLTPEFTQCPEPSPAPNPSLR
ncbi:hypothetical protein ANCDUO_25617 [Ancylostoma duodenale]|uniref:Uncharacterized protein n=1 Tax=Ancylostoma duodenale TaxID=51022 RepID=A0A0C2BKV2_9BILA|nr:hypothetical protein ANCDUO_25617 [Ancylostoma duodenale]